MSIVNRRNAVIGWATWKAAKIVAREKARHAKPAVAGGRPNKPALVAGAAALAGSLFFWKARKRGGAEAEAKPAGEADTE
jgi:hypothetical protein